MMPMTVVDLAETLDVEDAVTTGLVTVVEGAHIAWSMVRVAAGESWTAPAADLEERTCLVLEGKATVRVDEERQTLGSGQLVLVEPGATLAIDNEERTPFSVLFAVCPSTRHDTKDTER